MRSRCLSIAFTAFAISVAAPAAPLCGSASLTSYLVPGFTCEINSAIFSSFGYFATGSVTTPALTSEAITVSPLQTAAQVGLNFAGAYSSTGLPNGPGPAEGLLAVQYRFFFTVSMPGSLFTDTTVTLNGATRFSPNPLKFGGVLAGKSISNDGALAITNDQDPDLTDTAALNTARTLITIDETLQLSGGASAAGTASPVGVVTARSVDNLFRFETLVPEPANWTLGLTGVGLLLGLAALKKLEQHRHHG